MQFQSAKETEKQFSLTELCKELSISVATGKNWIKLGKLVPTSETEKTPLFSAEYVTNLKKDIQSGKNTSLKSRRNKKYITGNNLYASYISEDSKNVSILQKIINILHEKNITVTDEILCTILAECSVQFITQKNDSTQEVHLKDILYDTSYLGKLAFLVEDLIADYPCVISTIEKYPDLFTFKFILEEKEDILGLIYISLKNIGSRKSTGSYYTPTKIVKKLCDRLFSEVSIENKTVLDPCCGTGNFLLQLPQEIAFENIYGNDIDAISIKISRINMALKYGISNKEVLYTHLTQFDYLSHDLKNRYDFIIGNPPWGYDFSEDTKKNLRTKYSCAIGSSIESYDVIMEQSLSYLKKDGIVSFVLPEAFLTVNSHTPIRKLLVQSCSIQYLEFLGNAFDKVQCPCIILQILKDEKPFTSVGMVVKEENHTYCIKTHRTIDIESFNFLTTDEEYHLLNKITNIANQITLKGKATFALGIVTGNNKEYISNEKTIHNEKILKGSDIYKFRFKETNNYIIFKPESFQQVAPIEVYRAKEKLLYRFICNQLVFAYDNQQTLSLNSCNILIPTVEDLSIKYILAVLNSRIAQFYFTKKFHSIKVLRSHIEQLPIPLVDNKLQTDIIQIVDTLIHCTDETILYSLYEELDTILSSLFHLTKQEYALIKETIAMDNKFLI